MQKSDYMQEEKDAGFEIKQLVTITRLTLNMGSNIFPICWTTLFAILMKIKGGCQKMKGEREL